MNTRMEEELKCPVCNRFFCNPVLLPCFHSLCTVCAVQVQDLLPPIGQQHQQCQQQNTAGVSCGNPISSGVLDESGAGSVVGSESDLPDIDKLSIVSETDSGVICNSRPNSYIGTPGLGSIFFQATQGAVFSLRCPVCKKTIYLDEHGVQTLPKSCVLESMVEKFSRGGGGGGGGGSCGGPGGQQGPSGSSTIIKCQLCDDETDCNDASCMCEQCEIFYCDACRDRCHPPRGPLAKHHLMDPCQGQILLKRSKVKYSTCNDHVDEQLSMYCMICKFPVCYLCAQEGRHINHEVQALGIICKVQKSELSQNLQSLSEKAKSGTLFIQRLKAMTDRVENNCTEFQKSVIHKCDELIDSIKERKQFLLESLNDEKEVKILTLKEQVSHCTSLLQRTTGLLQYSIEVLKESDAFSFLQISGALINRVSSADENFNKEMELTPRISPEFELAFDNESILHAIQTMDFYQMKAPGQPVIITEDCSAENNSVTIAWQPHPSSIVEAFTLELDDGNNGDFRVVYVGRETICTVDGLHFNSIYNARVKAHNHAGESIFSELVSLQTAEVAWFCLDRDFAPPDVIFSENNQSASCRSFGHRVILGAVGLSKGVHYWEISIDRYDNHTDLAFGIARFDVDKRSMLGKDDKGWSMYIDDQRSWFFHCDNHSTRIEGGIKQGNVVGVLLDLNDPEHSLSYFVNSRPQGPIAFTDLQGVFFPAVSINRGVQVTLYTGLQPPACGEI